MGAILWLLRTHCDFFRFFPMNSRAVGGFEVGGCPPPPLIQPLIELIPSGGGHDVIMSKAQVDVVQS